MRRMSSEAASVASAWRRRTTSRKSILRQTLATLAGFGWQASDHASAMRRMSSEAASVASAWRRRTSSANSSFAKPLASLAGFGWQASEY